MLTVEQIRLLMDKDAASERKQEAETGQRYYNGKHDIEKRRIFFVDKDGNYQEDKLKCNIRISHPFHRELTDQLVQYLLSNDESYIRSDDAKLQAELDSRFNENETFTAELYKMLTGVIAKGWDYMYSYMDENKETCFQHADSLCVTEVRKNDTDENCEYLIYSHTETVIDKTVRRIEVYDAEKVWFYCQVDDGEIVEDDSKPINPRPHTLYKRKTDEKPYHNSKMGYGQIPFYRMDN